MQKYNLETFIKKAKEVHGDKYDYSKVVYKNSQTKVCIKCPEHGEFWQQPNSHLNGNGCPSCSGLKKRTTEEFIQKARDVHGNRYDYTNVIYVNKRSYVNIICPIHGEFTQVANNHLRGQGCPNCGKKYASLYRKNDYVHFIEESKKRFGDTYEFNNITNEYENSHSKVSIKCKNCGKTFIKIACDHLTSPNGGCPVCYCHESKPENEIYDYVCSLVGEDKVVKNTRNIIYPFEIDIYIPEMNIGIEYNGNYWHSETNGKNKNYHLEKLEACNKRGIRLIQIFEDEYELKKNIVLCKLAHILHKNTTNEKIYARKCTIKEITYKDTCSFLEDNHIQGSCKSSVYLGCYHKDILVGVMTFKICNKKYNSWELTRFATNNLYICSGIGGKLFTFFIRTYAPTSVKSFADRRWSDNLSNNLYTNIGFKIDTYTRPDYRYIKNGDIKRYHKFNFRKKILNKKYNLPLSMSEKEMSENIGLNKIWDCGLIKYVWKNE